MPPKKQRKKRLSKAGRKPLPPERLRKFRKEFGFTEREFDIIQRAADQSSLELGVFGREAILAAARRLGIN